jgi:hypothetical protein
VNCCNQIGEGGSLSQEPNKLEKPKKGGQVSLPKINHKISAEKLLQELQVHQIELERQNAALRESEIALAESRDHYLK